MTEGTINDSLWFVKDPRGAVLHFHFSEGGTVDAFSVGMNRKSLTACYKALKLDTVYWRNADVSLTVEGKRNMVTLTFALQGPPYGTKTITLQGSSLEAFRSTLASLIGK